MKILASAAAAFGFVAVLVLAGPAAAQYGMDRNPPANATTPQLPQCARPIGTAAVQEPQNRWWESYNLSSPEVLIKLFAQRSNCLRIVDRNAGLAMRNQEADLGHSGALQPGSNVGNGQVAAADFFLIPDIANSNHNASGNNIGAAVGSFLPGGFGALAANIHTNTSEAQVLITLVNARTTEQLYVAEGAAKKTDVSFGGGGGGGGWSGFAALAGGHYSDTDIGKVITGAYFNAFVDLVHYMQQSAAPVAAVENQPQQAYNVIHPTLMKTQPNNSAHTVRSLGPGDEVFPTGQRDGIWWQVDDENANRGWVPNTTLSPR